MAAMRLFNVLTYIPFVHRMLVNKSNAIIHSDAFLLMAAMLLLKVREPFHSDACSQALMAAILLFKVLTNVPTVAHRLTIFLTGSGNGLTIT